MRRIHFEKGKQRKFLDKVIEELNVLSLRGLLQFGFEVKYSTLKNYYNESRKLPENLFEDLCGLAQIDLKDLEFEYLSGHWGKVKGGEKSKRVRKI